MKRLFSSILFLVAFFATTSAQDNASVKVLFNPADTTYRFCEVDTRDGDTISIRFFPERPMKSNDFIKYTTGLIRVEQERRNELERLKREVQKNIVFLTAQIDSIEGAGAWSIIESDIIKSKMQGAWTLVSRQEGKEPDFLTVIINESTLHTNESGSADITWGDSQTFRLNRGIYEYDLEFNIHIDRYVAKYTDPDGKLWTYVLKR